jgi:hypothetical protein
MATHIVTFSQLEKDKYPPPVDNLPWKDEINA